MMIFAVVDGVAFTPFGYVRGGRYRAYREGGTVTLFGHQYPTHRAIAFAQATPYQRARFASYDAHHVHGRGGVLTWWGVKLLTAGAHRAHHARGHLPKQ